MIDTSETTNTTEMRSDKEISKAVSKLLNKYLKEKGVKKGFVINKLDISRWQFQQKEQGIYAFTIQEIGTLAEIFGATPEFIINKPAK